MRGKPKNMNDEIFRRREKILIVFRKEEIFSGSKKWAAMKQWRWNAKKLGNQLNLGKIKVEDLGLCGAKNKPWKVTIQWVALVARACNRSRCTPTQLDVQSLGNADNDLSNRPLIGRAE